MRKEEEEECSNLFISSSQISHNMSLIQLLESPIPATTPATTSQKASIDDISGNKRDIIDPLVSKRPRKNSE